MKKIGLFGGTFNPPHLGHMLFAQEALSAFELDEIWFVPVNIPPHKKKENLASNEERVEMLRRSIQWNQDFFVSMIEVEREGPSYTIETVLSLRTQYPSYDFYFLIGGDMIDYLPKWEKIDELMDLVTFIGVDRPGARSESSYAKQVQRLEMIQVDYSSTFIRKRIKEGKPITYMVTREVESYIKERAIYES
ncbi:nicotinate-nucleotide adenylyltransferase [Bacillus suaedae]|uniref:Probable nicotinate-nucleotide adenylyltransferase n=1 Tax=Halalkalibacter suaedae TaxID=2822140 RepID=A0A940WZ96_9BACI|nr:nicotinate-nucleotide adenylyltransferase [Bacillus suaedae]MBP3951336.1 nicotinate-nucleotide adenylyltransferase [Bacillus suaedae]